MRTLHIGSASAFQAEGVSSILIVRSSNVDRIRCVLYYRTMKHKEKIIQLRSEGKTYNQIVEILGCSKGTIAYHLSESVKVNYNTRRRSYRRVIDKHIRDYKESFGCIDCGEKYPYYMLDLDHISDNKKFSVSAYRSHTSDIDIIKEEIAKCEVVCSNCHRMRTYERSSRA